MADWSFSSALFYDRNGNSANFRQEGTETDANGVLTDGQSDDQFLIGDEITTSFGGVDYTGSYGGTLVTDDATYVWVYLDDDTAILFSPLSLEETLADPDVDNVLSTTRDIDPGDFTVCFTAGTMIATPDGARAVETLAAGDLVLTADGRQVPVRWLGRQTIAPRFADVDRLTLVRIDAGALGDGLPTRDLTVTADHAMLVDGVLCQAAALVNGGTIREVPNASLGPRVTVFHVELDAHEVILANGAATESYVDMAPRRVFDNHDAYLAAFGADRKIPEMDLPRVHSPRQLPAAIRARLAGRAAA